MIRALATGNPLSASLFSPSSFSFPSLTFSFFFLNFRTLFTLFLRFIAPFLRFLSHHFPWGLYIRTHSSCLSRLRCAPLRWASKLRLLQTPKYYQEHGKTVERFSDILLKLDLESGHFSASDRYKYIRERSFEQAYIMYRLGVLNTDDAKL